MPEDNTNHDSLDGVVEIVEAGRRNTNLYLDNGYRLLRASVTTRLLKRDAVPWVRKDFTYVLGRSAEVAHYDPPLREFHIEDCGPVEEKPTS